MKPPLGVRRAGVEDLARVSATLALAFADYPWTSWTVAADDRRRRLEGLFEANLRGLGPETGEIWVTEDHAAAAVWIPPGAAEGRVEGLAEEPGAYMEAAYEALIGDRLPQAREAEALVEVHRPRQPHWYLASLGVRPDRQGEGLGPLMLYPVLSRCNEDSLPAYTETSAHRNVPFYRRHGFEVIKELDVPGDGPHVWLLWRDPR